MFFLVIFVRAKSGSGLREPDKVRGSILSFGITKESKFDGGPIDVTILMVSFFSFESGDLSS